MEPIVEADRVVVNWRAAEFEPFVFEGGEPTGESVLQLDRSQPPGVGFHLYRMAPGAVTTPHRHTCDEQFLVVEGDLIDHDGYVYGPGDFVLLREGTRHNSRTETGCVLAVFIATPEAGI